MRKSYKFKRKETIEKKFAVNFQIRAPLVSVIDEQGAPLGDMETRKAIMLAEERGLDLVEVNPKGVPPVAKFLSFSSFQYQKEKQLKKQKKLGKSLSVKSIRLSVNIGDHDRETKMNQANRFLEKGHKLKIEVILKGRQMQFIEPTRLMIREFAKTMALPVDIEQDVTKQGNKVFMIVLPKKDA